eukprot:160697_1
MNAFLCILTLFPFVYSQGEQCGSTTTGPVAKGVDFVDFWSVYTATNKVTVPRIGVSEYAVDYGGYQFYFVNSTNQNIFKQNADKYAPQYGCYCSWAMSGHDTHCPNPPSYCLGGLCYDNTPGYAFLDYNGGTRLYCFLGQGANNLFSADPAQYIADANANFNKTVSAQTSHKGYCENTNMFRSKGQGQC